MTNVDEIKTSKEEEEVLKRLEIILRKPAYNPDSNIFRFYKEEQDRVYKFSNQTVILLLALTQRLTSDKEKQIFWKAIYPIALNNFLGPFLRPTTLFDKIRGLTNTHCDFIFVFLIKNGKLDEAFETVNKTDLLSEKLLYALYEILLFESRLFSDLQLEKILLISKKLKNFCFDVKDYHRKKAEHKRALQESEFHEKVRASSLASGLLGMTPPTFPAPKPIFEENLKFERFESDIIKRCEGILKDIDEKAYEIQINRLSSELLGGVNLEINQDEEKLKLAFKEFNFDPRLGESLSEIEKLLRDAQNEFGFKRWMDSVRTLQNEVIISIALQLVKATKVQPKQLFDSQVNKERYGNALRYLESREISFWNEDEKHLIGAFNQFLSNTGVHALSSPQENARIARNMAIEIGYFLVQKLKKYLLNSTSP